MTINLQGKQTELLDVQNRKLQPDHTTEMQILSIKRFFLNSFIPPFKFSRDCPGIIEIILLQKGSPSPIGRKEVEQTVFAIQVNEARD